MNNELTKETQDYLLSLKAGDYINGIYGTGSFKEIISEPPAIIKLAAVIIGKNDGDYLPECLATARSIAEAVFYVDTGSDSWAKYKYDITCDEIELAAKYGAFTGSIEWNKDFSSARNRAKLFAKNAEWILSLDCDERIYDPQGEIRELLSKVDDKVGGISIEVRSKATTNDRETEYKESKIRIYRKQLNFRNPVHEEIYTDIIDKDFQVLTAETSWIQHVGNTSEEQIEEKDKKYKEILENDIKETGNYASYRHLALYWLRHNEPLKAFDAILKSYENCPVTSPLRNIVVIDACHISKLAGQYTKAFEFANDYHQREIEYLRHLEKIGAISINEISVPITTYPIVVMADFYKQCADEMKAKNFIIQSEMTAMINFYMEKAVNNYMASLLNYDRNKKYGNDDFNMYVSRFYIVRQLEIISGKKIEKKSDGGLFLPN